MNYCVHIFLFRKKVLLLKRSKKNNFFPSIWTPIIGKIKEKEIPEKAVIRETIEETSLNLSNNISFYGKEKYNNDTYWFYYSKYDNNFPTLELNHENEDYDFFDVNDLPNTLWVLFQNKIRILSSQFTY